MNNEGDDNEAEETSQSLEMKRHRSRLSSKRTREKERSLIDAVESERIRLHLSNTALRYHSSHLREAIQAVKNQLSNPSSSIASSSSNQGSSENSYPTGVPRNVQYGPVGGNGPQQVLPNNLSATLPQQQQIPQMAPPLTADLNQQIAQGNPFLAGTALNAGMLQSRIQQQQTPFQTALQAEMNRRLLPAPLTFPIAQVQPFQPPVNLAAAANAAATLTKWIQLPPGSGSSNSDQRR